MTYTCDFFYFLNWLILSIPENCLQYAASDQISEDELLSYDPCARIAWEKMSRIAAKVLFRVLN